MATARETEARPIDYKAEALRMGGQLVDEPTDYRAEALRMTSIVSLAVCSW